MDGNRAIAKVSPPRIFEATLRERLFERLDALRQRPCLWLSAPAGAGKSTLIATYLDARALPAAWFRVDATDDDLPSFFFALSRAANSWIGSDAELPLFTPEFAPDVAGFTRRFFRRLFALLERYCVLVLDDLHEAPAVATILRDALEELPQGLAVWVLARNEAPAEMSRAAAYGHLVTLTWDELRLTEAEAIAIGVARGVRDTGTVAALNAGCEGWAAGLAMALNVPNMARSIGPSGASELLNRFFSVEIFESLPAATQDVLLATAFLPEFSATEAAFLSGVDDAAQRLEGQYRRQCFISRPGALDLYRHHDLFRNFLRSRATASLPLEQIDQLRVQSAELLCARGAHDEAVNLLAASRRFEALAGILTQQAEAFIQTSRHRTLERWLGLLPREFVRTDPWLTYWHGMSVVTQNAAQAELEFSEAHRQFQACGDRSGQLLAATGAIGAILTQVNSNVPLDPWIKHLEPHLDTSDASTKSADQVRAWYAFLQAALNRQPGHPMIPHGIAWLRRYLKEGGLSEAEALHAGAVLLFYACIAADHEIATDIVAGYADVVQRDDMPPIARWTWHYWHGVYRLWKLEYEYAKQCWEHCMRISADCGLTILDFMVHGSVVMIDLAEDRLDVAEWRLEQIEEARKTEHKIAALYWMAQMFLRLYRRRGNVQEAMNRMIESARQAALFNLELLCLGDAAAVHLIYGREAEARVLLDEARARRQGTVVRMVDSQLVALEAVLQYRAGEVQLAHETFSRALDLVAQVGTCGCMLWVRAGLSTLFGEAVRYGRHPLIVRDLVRRYQIPPPSRTTEHWPWPVRIRVYGGLQIEVNDEPLRTKRKAQQKVLELLKLLIAEGGTNVDSGMIADWLWPDADGDSAQNNLRATLKRLRDLLGHGEAVRSYNGKLSLNDRICWLDSWALREWLQSVLEEPAAIEAEDTSLDRLQALYRGPLLRGEEAPWLDPARRRERQYLRHVMHEVSRVNQRAASRFSSYAAAVDPDLAPS